jgi:hypothetical protein
MTAKYKSRNFKNYGQIKPGREAEHSPPSSAEVNNAWSHTSTPQYAFMAWCSVKAQGQLYLYGQLNGQMFLSGRVFRQILNNCEKYES